MILFALLTSLLLPAELPPENPKTPEAWVLIVDPGSALFTRFGHSAFLIRHPDGEETVYDFGVFEFDSGFAVRFIKGKAKYYLDKRDFTEFMDSYMKERRTVRGHLMDLSPSKVKELEDILEARFASEERYYQYHHFSNNCATQMLTLLSRLFKGDVQHSLEKIPIVPWRTNLGTVLGDWTLLNWGLRLILSSELDSKRSAWTGSFLPYLLERALFATTVSEDPFSPKRPLIKKSVTFYKGIKHIEKLQKPWWFFMVAGLFLILMLLPFAMFKRSIFLKVALGLYAISSLMLFSVLVFLHLHLDICAYNLNMLAFFPFLLLTLPFMGGDRIYRPRSGYLIAISGLFPLLQIFLRFFTIQKSAPFPEVVFMLHLVFFGEWLLLTSMRKRRRRRLAKEAEVSPEVVRSGITRLEAYEGAPPDPDPEETPPEESDAPA